MIEKTISEFSLLASWRYFQSLYYCKHLHPPLCSRAIRASSTGESPVRYF